MAHTTLSVTDEQLDDLKICKQQTGVDMSRVLMDLYQGWREGKISMSTLPKGDCFDGPLHSR